MKVSWQVTGIRQDPYANAHRIPIEEEKPTKFKGFYLHPEVYGHSFKEGLSYVKLGGKTLEELRAAFATEKSQDKSEALPARTKD